MKRIFTTLFLSFFFVCEQGTKSLWAQEHAPLVVESSYMDYVKSEPQRNKHPKEQEEKGNKTITMSTLDAIKLAGRLVDAGDFEHATQILTMMPKTNSLPIEIERWYLLAQIEQRKGNIDEAIKIYRKILDDQPDLAKVRYELALCYMAKHQWYRADYHLRLALAGKNIPDNVKQRMMYLRYIARQNKRWNLWFNFGAAPDNNINQASGGEEYIINEWGKFKRNLPKPEKAIGYNFTLGGNYEFVLNNNWRWKNEANVYTNIYNKHKFDDLYLSGATGPRYIWERGDVWTAAIASRRWYGWDKYNWAIGGKIDSHYDWTRKITSGLTLRILDNTYDEYGDYMDGQTYGISTYTSYSFDASKYIVVSGSVDRDTAKNDIYANWRYTTGLGFGAEIPWGFSLYLDSSFYWTNYDGERWAVKNHKFTEIAERNFTQRYSISLSNNKIDIWGFVPTFTFSYTKRDSNIHSREYEKWTTEFTMRQRF